MSTLQRSVPHAFTTAVDRFRQGLIGDEIKTFNHLTCEKDVWDSIEELQKEQASRNALRNMARIEPFITGIAQYARVIEVFVQVKPEIMALIWVRGHFQIPPNFRANRSQGPLKLLLQVVSILNRSWKGKKLIKGFLSLLIISSRVLTVSWRRLGKLVKIFPDFKGLRLYSLIVIKFKM